MWPLLLTAGLLAALDVFAWRRRTAPGVRPFAAGCLFALIWVAGAAAESMAVALGEGAWDQARARCEASLAVWRQSAGHPTEFEGELACLALAHLRAQLAWAHECRMLMPGLFGLVAAARLLADEGQVEHVIELYALASRYSFVAGSRWFEDVAGKPITGDAASLPPETAGAARERGRARDLEATVAELLTELSE